MKLDLKELIAKLTNTPMIVEEGTSGNWEYRKWNSGYFEAVKLFTSLTSSDFGTTETINGVRRSRLNGVTGTIPFITTVTAVNVSGSNSGCWVVGTIAANDIYIFSQAISGTALPSTVSVQVIGKWK